MLSKEDNDLATDVKPGTPMGELFRRFWLPVMLADELPVPDCEPARVRVLGEDLIAFRDTRRPRRPHRRLLPPPRRADVLRPQRGRRPALRLPRLEVRRQRRLRRPAERTRRRDLSRARSTSRRYPCVEAGDLIWAYMGPADKKPPFPAFEWLNLPNQNRYVRKFRLECNYLQAMEGDYDPSPRPLPAQHPRGRQDPEPAQPQRAHPAHQPDVAGGPRSQRRSVPAYRRYPPRHRQKPLATDRRHRFGRPSAIAAVEDAPGQWLANLQVTSCCRSSARPASAARTPTSATCACRSTTRASCSSACAGATTPSLRTSWTSTRRRLLLPGADPRHLHPARQRPQRLQHRPREAAQLHLHGHPDVPAAGHRHDGEPVGPHRRPRAGAPHQLATT